MERAAFAKLNAERVAAGEEPWKNPRNSTAGALKLLDPRESARRPMKLLTYEVVGDARGRTHFELLAWMKSLGLPVSADVARVTSLEELLAYVAGWQHGSGSSCPTPPTGWSSRSTRSRSAGCSAPPTARRAGPSPTSFPPSRRPRSYCRSR